MLEAINACIDILKDNGSAASTNRIFQASSYQTDARKLYKALFINGPKALSDIYTLYSPLCVADVLKRLIKSLPQSLLTDDLVYHFLEANGDKTRIQVLIEKLPFTNHLLLKKLINTCKIVLDNCEITNMDISSLAVNIGPSLINYFDVFIN